MLPLLSISSASSKINILMFRVLRLRLPIMSDKPKYKPKNKAIASFLPENNYRVHCTQHHAKMVLFLKLHNFQFRVLISPQTIITIGSLECNISANNKYPEVPTLLIQPSISGPRVGTSEYLKLIAKINEYIL